MALGKKLNGVLVSTAAAALTSLGGMSMSAHAGSVITISFEPSQTTVDVGESFTVDIVAFIQESLSIVGWGMDVTFDPGVLSHDASTGVSLGSLFAAAPGGDGDNLDGLVLPPADPVFGDHVVLATLTFTGGAEGVTVLSGGLTAGDSLEGFVRSGGDLVPVNFGSVTVTVVPMPPALLLGTCGIAMVGVGRNRRRRA